MMKAFLGELKTIHALLTVLALFALLGGAGERLAHAAALSEQEIVADAPARIERYRKGDITLKLVDAQGRALTSGTLAHIEQTRHHFLFGADVFELFDKRFYELAGAGPFKVDDAYAEAFASLCNFATLPLYWFSYEPQQGKLRDKPIEAMLDWCQSRGITAKGHALAYNLLDMAWLPEAPAEVHRLQLQRARREARRYAGHIAVWDVSNELTDYRFGENPTRGRRLTAAIDRVGLTTHASELFRAARQADPKATLLINDYRRDQEYADKIIAMLTDERGRPLYDVIGIQAHQHVEEWSAQECWATCERFAGFGRPIHISEVTILSGEHGWDLTAKKPKGFKWVSTPEGEARQAEAVERFYTIMFSHPKVEAISWWDLTDRRAWMDAPAGLLRADLTPKPAYTRLKKLIKETWWTRTEKGADKNGCVRLRGFYGDYKVTVTGPEGKAMQGTFSLTPGASGSVDVRLQPAK